MILLLTRTVSRAAGLAALLLVLAATTGRPDLAVLAAPFVLGPALALTRGRPAVRAGLQLRSARAAEGGTVDALVTVVADGSDVDLAEVRLTARPGQRGPRPLLVALAAGETRTAVLPLPAPRWGRHTVGGASVLPYGPGLALRGASVTTPVTPLTVLPAVQPFDAADHALPARLRAGNHRSRQAGPGVEPVAVRPYAAGDRLRQVDWRTTSRTGALHVRATTTDSATEVVVLLDTLSDLGPPGDTVLDTAVRAAAGIVDHYLAEGDRVGLVQYGGRLRTLAARSGRSQRSRAEEWLLDVRPPLNALVAERSEAWTPTSRGTAALVVALTPLLDEQTAVLLATLRRRGAVVVAVDVLPAQAQPVPSASAEGEIARRLWLLEREALQARLGELGVPVVPWGGAGSIDAVLATLVRVSAAPRAGVR